MLIMELNYGRFRHANTVMRPLIPLSQPPLRLRFFLAKYEQIVKVQVPSTYEGKNTRSLEPHILNSSQKSSLAARDTLDGVQVYELNARKAITLYESADTGHRVMMEMILSLQVCNSRLNTPQQFCEPCPGGRGK